MGNKSPSRAAARKKYNHISIKVDPYWNTIHRWAVERTCTNAEMLEKIIKTYAALLGEDLHIPEPAEPTQEAITARWNKAGKFSYTDDYEA